MDPANVIWSFLVATLLGLLIGLERERKREQLGSIFAGVRTFALFALFGAVTGQLAQLTNLLLAVVGLAVLGLLILIGYWRSSTGEKIGGTSEVAAFVTFGLGLLAGYDQLVVALAGAVLTTAVLSLKDELHTLAGAVTRADLYAVVQFAAVSLVILPLVPDDNLGPWGVWNPRTIWLLVVLISGISFVGYLSAKAIGAKRGIGLSGLLGGMASSTAVALSFSERSKANPGLSLVLAVGVLGASAVMVPRLLILLGIVQPNLIAPLLLPFGALFVVTTLGGALVYRLSRRQPVASVQFNNPFELKTALTFALLFAIILVAARAAQEFFGASGLYLASLLAGLTQLDAITLTLGQEVGKGLEVTVAVRAMAVAIAGNSLFKASLAVMLGSRPFGRAILLTLLLAAAACVATAWLLPPLTLDWGGLVRQ
ncbi:MAG: MgtC/SapB family protein [Truepera sp.]|nr:MgtC/SapB family protein [Truepera sp.]